VECADVYGEADADAAIADACRAEERGLVWLLSCLLHCHILFKAAREFRIAIKFLFQESVCKGLAGPSKNAHQYNF